MARFELLFIFNILLIPLVVYCERDFYKILKVPRGSSADDIKKSYRTLAKQLHPDKHKNDPAANQKFMDLNDAYSILSDPKLKEYYDKCGEQCVSKENNNNNVDNFASFFGFQFGNQNDDRGETPKGATIVMDLYVTLDELYHGHFVQVTRKKAIVQAAKGTRKCNCRQELITKSMGNERLLMQQTVCDECPNVKLVNEERQLEIEVEPGMIDGQEIKFVHEGEPHVDGEPGDLVFKIRTMVHDKFERRGNDLYTNLTISLEDALVGFETSIRHLSGLSVKIVRDKVTPPGTRIRFAAKGMPHNEDYFRRGNLYVTFDVAFPKTTFSEEDKTTLSRILNQGSSFKLYNGLQGF